MTKQKYSELPVKKTYLEKMCLAIKNALDSGQSVTLTSLPASGKTAYVKYLMREGVNTGGMIGELFTEYAFWYIDLELVGKSTDLEDRVAKEIGSPLSSYTYDHSKPVVLVVDNAERLVDVPEIIVAKLWQLQQVNPMAIRFVFLCGKELNYSEVSTRLPRLGKQLWQNMVWLPLLSGEEMAVSVELQAQRAGVTLTTHDQVQIGKRSGGWPALMRILVTKNKLTDEQLLEDKEVLACLNRVYQALGSESRRFIKSGKKPSTYLIETGLVKKGNGGWVYCCPVIENYLKQKGCDQECVWQEKNNRLYLGHKDLTSLLTKREYRAVNCLWEERNRVVSRDRLAEAVWGEGWEDHYSDWAIDKLLMRIRAKIGDTGVKRLIRIVKGEGLVLEA